MTSIRKTFTAENVVALMGMRPDCMNLQVGFLVIKNQAVEFQPGFIGKASGTPFQDSQS